MMNGYDYEYKDDGYKYLYKGRAHSAISSTAYYRE